MIHAVVETRAHCEIRGEWGSVEEARETEESTATARTYKEIVQQGFDALNDRDRDAFVELHAEDAVLHDTDEEYHGIDDIAEVEFAFFDAFPDLTLTLDEMVADGDTVAAR